MPLNHSKLPNMKNIDPDPNFSNPPFNPGLKYGVPYMWGTMGVGYRKSKVKKPTTSWKVLFDSDEYSGRIALLLAFEGMEPVGHEVDVIDAPEIDITDEMKTACEGLVPPVAETMLDLVAGVEVRLNTRVDPALIQVEQADAELALINEHLGDGSPRSGGSDWRPSSTPPPTSWLTSGPSSPIHESCGTSSPNPPPR